MATTLTTDRLRELAAFRSQPGKVLSVFLNLDPSDFATAEARSSAITSLLDAADRAVRDRADKATLEADVERVRAFFEGEFDAKGARGLALFCSTQSGLFEVMKLDHPIDSGVFIDDGPYIEPIAPEAGAVSYVVLLTNRRNARVFRGDADRLTTLGEINGDTPNHHEKGGWSQARFQRSVDNAAEDHLREVAEELFELHKRRPIEGLIVGAPTETYDDAVAHLHPYLRERLCGRIEVDVEHSTTDDIRAALAPVIAAREKEDEAALLARMREGIGAGGRAVGGLDDTLAMLNEARVEALLFDHGFSVPGVCCEQCGFLGAAFRTECPADGTPLTELEDVVPRAIERALEQSARVVVMRHHEDLGPLGSIAAVLRF